MGVNIQPSDRVAVVGNIDPDANAAATYTTDWVSIAQFASLMAVVQAGTLGTNATLDAKLEQATTSAGAGAKDVTGKAITQLTQAGTDDSDKQAVINCGQEDLDVANSFAYVRLSVTVGTAASDCGAVLLGFDPAYAPASNNDASTVAEIV